VSVLPTSKKGERLATEICRHIANLPEAMCFKRKYQNQNFWCDFLAWEHNAWQASAYGGTFQSREVHAGVPYFADDEDEDEQEQVNCPPSTRPSWLSATMRRRSCRRPWWHPRQRR
jgi:hypothetical protein